MYNIKGVTEVGPLAVKRFKEPYPEKLFVNHINVSTFDAKIHIY